ncbi:MAG: helix-turn-helix domain-containing protein [Defluviitaleaceae bacterium]|nr:helix-turn-helix domain-containing protein [Defluviitaleaceae bacterium]
MTQTEFANAAGVTRSIVTNIEKNRGTSLAALDQIARTFRVSVADLVKTDPIVPKSLSNTMGNIDFDKEFAELSPNAQAYIKATGAMMERYFRNRSDEEMQTHASRRVESMVIKSKGAINQTFIICMQSINNAIRGKLPADVANVVMTDVQQYVYTAMDELDMVLSNWDAMSQ